MDLRRQQAFYSFVTKVFKTRSKHHDAGTGSFHSSSVNSEILVQSYDIVIEFSIVFLYLDSVIDNRQDRKVQHKMSDIIALVFFAIPVNAVEWISIDIFGEEHETFLKKYLEFPNGKRYN